MENHQLSILFLFWVISLILSSDQHQLEAKTGKNNKLLIKHLLEAEVVIEVLMIEEEIEEVHLIRQMIKWPDGVSD